jgi:hypothetical protein
MDANVFQLLEKVDAKMDANVFQLLEKVIEGC